MSIIMFLLFVLFLVLPRLSAGSYATQLGLPCSSLDSVGKDELKKTKVWKKCHDSNKKMKKCVDKGMRVSDVESFVDKDRILCDYIKSIDHTKYYTDKLEKEKGSILKTYKKSEEFAEKVEELKVGYLKFLANETSSKMIEGMKLEYESKIAELHHKTKETVMDLLSRMVRLTDDYDQKVKKKVQNIDIEYEKNLLDSFDHGLSLHLDQENEDYKWPTSPIFPPTISTHPTQTPWQLSDSAAGHSVVGTYQYTYRTDLWSNNNIIRKDEKLEKTVEKRMG